MELLFSKEGMRFVGTMHAAVLATRVSAGRLPPSGNIAAPGHYLLFVVDTARVPSVAAWIRVTP